MRMNTHRQCGSSSDHGNLVQHLSKLRTPGIKNNFFATTAKQQITRPSKPFARGEIRQPCRTAEFRQSPSRNVDLQRGFYWRVRRSSRTAPPGEESAPTRRLLHPHNLEISSQTSNDVMACLPSRLPLVRNQRHYTHFREQGSLVRNHRRHVLGEKSFANGNALFLSRQSRHGHMLGPRRLASRFEFHTDLFPIRHGQAYCEQR
jgi:hypothetical protein